MRCLIAAVLPCLAACAGAGTSTAPDGGHPPPPPANAQIVFDGFAAGGHREVYVVSLDGSGLRQLTSSTGDDVDPTAAAGTVVFTSWRDGNAELYSIGLDATGERRLTTTKANETLPALAPDAHAIAYVSDGSGVAKVWLASRDLANASAVTASSFAFPGAIETNPAWNPASDRLVFVATASATGSAALFTGAAQVGSMPSPIGASGTSAPEVEPSWSADGRRVAYASSTGGVSQIFVRDLTSSVVTRVTSCSAAAPCGQPSWLGDGRIVYTVFSASTSSLAWIDPAEPATVHQIPIGALSAEHPSAVR